MTVEIIKVVDTVSEAKDLEREVIFEAIENAIASATKKKYTENMDVRVIIDRNTGEYKTYRQWMVFEDESTELEFPDQELRMIDAVDIDENATPGEYVEVPIDSVEFGRISAQMAKQVIVQKVREAERDQVTDEYKDREGELLSGLVKRVDRNGAYIDLGGNAEGFIPRENLIPREAIRMHDRVKALLAEVKDEPRGPQLILTRTSPQFLIELFKIEVPEVGQGLIEILGSARDPGLRAKISVKSNEPRIDPVGACVGIRGSRVQSVSNELAGERVDIILWNDNPAQYVINAMSPAEVISIVVDEDAHSMDVAVDEEKLSQAIGRGGQNIRLASELTEWELNVMTEVDADMKSEQETRGLIELFTGQLDVDEEVALILVQEGFASVEEVAYVPASELMQIEEFDEDIVDELRNRARDVLLTQAIVAEEIIENAEPAEDLLELKGVTKTLASKLASKGVITREDLAELASDDLIEIHDMEKEKADALIMEARSHWFDEDEK